MSAKRRLNVGSIVFMALAASAVAGCAGAAAGPGPAGPRGNDAKRGAVVTSPAPNPEPGIRIVVSRFSRHADTSVHVI